MNVDINCLEDHASNSDGLMLSSWDMDCVAEALEMTSPIGQRATTPTSMVSAASTTKPEGTALNKLLCELFDR